METLHIVSLNASFIFLCLFDQTNRYTLNNKIKKGCTLKKILTDYYVKKAL